MNFFYRTNVAENLCFVTLHVYNRCNGNILVRYVTATSAFLTENTNREKTVSVHMILEGSESMYIVCTLYINVYIKGGGSREKFNFLKKG